VTLAYDFGALVAPGAAIWEEVPGLVAYFSLTGGAGSWQVIPELSASAPVRLIAELNPGLWPSGAWLFVLWADDNGAANADSAGLEEGAYTLDNFVVWPGPRWFTSRLAGTQAELAWRFPSTGFELQSNSNLTTAAWQRVTNATRPSDGFHRVTVDTARGAAFFRLERR